LRQVENNKNEITLLFGSKPINASTSNINRWGVNDRKIIFNSKADIKGVIFDTTE
jgi:hypothetical protein